MIIFKFYYQSRLIYTFKRAPAVPRKDETMNLYDNVYRVVHVKWATVDYDYLEAEVDVVKD